jgi:hypothetical protein
VPSDVDVILLPRGDPPEPRFDDFSHAAELITQSYGASCAHLDALAGGEGKADQPMPPSHPSAAYDPPAPEGTDEAPEEPGSFPDDAPRLDPDRSGET